MSLRGLVAERLICKKCGEHPILSGYSGNSYWWCYRCDREVL